MTKLQQEVIDHLFSGGYLMRRDRHRYTMYKEMQNPVRIYIWETVKPVLQLCKRDRLDRYTLNLNLVKQQRGNSYIKQLYNVIREIKQQGAHTTTG